MTYMFFTLLVKISIVFLSYFELKLKTHIHTEFTFGNFLFLFSIVNKIIKLKVSE